MGVLIEGMEMPKSYKDIRIYADGRIVSKSLRTYGEEIATAVPVPEPHGRLIDADALLNHLEQLLSYCTPGSNCALRVREMMVELETTPTVIPANHGQGPDET